MIEGPLHEFLVWFCLVGAVAVVVINVGFQEYPRRLLLISVGTISGGFLIGIFGHLLQDNELQNVFHYTGQREILTRLFRSQINDEKTHIYIR